MCVCVLCPGHRRPHISVNVSPSFVNHGAAVCWFQRKQILDFNSVKLENVDTSCPVWSCGVRLKKTSCCETQAEERGQRNSVLKKKTLSEDVIS